MRHRKKRHLKGSKDRQRKELRALANALVLHEGIETTKARAKLARSKVEKLITTGKEADLGARRKLMRDLSRNAADKVLEVLSPRFSKRNGGYTRIVNLGVTKDGTKKVRLEFIDEKEAEKK